MNVELNYGRIATIPAEMQKIGYGRMGVYVGINGKGKSVLLNRTPESIRCILGDFCSVMQSYNEDNIATEPKFIMLNGKEEFLSMNEKSLAEKILSRRML